MKNKIQYTRKDIKYLCNYNKNIFHNIKEYIHYRKRKKYLLKNGYSPSAVWDTDTWFVDTMLSILQEHFNYNEGNLDLIYIENEELQQDIKEMIALLENMREKYWSLELDDKETKEEFFKLFSKNFHRLWN